MRSVQACAGPTALLADQSLQFLDGAASGKIRGPSSLLGREGVASDASFGEDLPGGGKRLFTGSHENSLAHRRTFRTNPHNRESWAVSRRTAPRKEHELL